MHLLMAAILVLQPALADDGDLRLVAAGTGDETIAWHIDGALVGTTTDREALTMSLPAGTYEITAETDHSGAWRVLARPDGTDADGATYVQGWSASSDGIHEPPAPDRPFPWTATWLAALGLGLIAWPRRSEAGK